MHKKHFKFRTSEESRIESTIERFNSARDRIETAVGIRPVSTRGWNTSEVTGAEFSLPDLEKVAAMAEFVKEIVEGIKESRYEEDTAVLTEKALKRLNENLNKPQ